MLYDWSCPNPTVNLSVSTTSGTEAGATVITVTATASAAVTGAQTVALGVNGSGITAGDYTLSNTTITIPSGQTMGTVTFTVVNDALVEGAEMATLTISSPSSGIALGTTTTRVITITDNDFPTVNLSVSTNTATEAGATVVTVTATASPAVTVNQAVALFVTGTGITAGDYTLSNTTITIPSGQTTGTVTFTVVNDAVDEPNETVTLDISDILLGITLGATTTQNIVITDDDVAGVTVTQSGGSTNVTEGGATDDYTVVLTSQPTANVTVSITPGTQVTTSPTPSLTFSAANWNTPQTVTVTAVDDAAVEGAHTGTITHTTTSADTDYNGSSVASVVANITDNDVAAICTASIVMNNGPICSGEDAVFTVTGTNGATLTYHIGNGNTTLLLDGTNQTITVPNATENTPGATTNGVVAHLTLTLVSVSTTSPSCTTLLSATSVVDIYDKPTITPIPALAARCAGSSITIPTGFAVSENGSSLTGILWQLETGVGTGMFTNISLPYITSFADNGKKFRLAATNGCGTTYSNELDVIINNVNTAGAPSSTPTLVINTALTAITHVTTGATGIGMATNLPAGVSAAWAANVITISGIPSAPGTFNYSIPLTGGCGTVNATGTITVTATVNLSVSTNAGTEVAATSITATATASAAVSGDQTVTLTVTGTNITTGDYTLNNNTTNSVTITIPNGMTTGTATFKVVDDAIDENTETATLTISSPSAGITLGATTTQNIVITDDDVAGVMVTESGGSTNVTEGGATDDYTVVLTSQPTDDVTINIVVGTAPLLTSLVANDATSGFGAPVGQVTTSPTSLTFTSSNWNMLQTVTVTAVDDADVEGPHSETISHEASSDDPNYNGTVSCFGCIGVANVNVSITDNDVTCTASIVTNNGPICSGQNAVFTVTGTNGANLTYNTGGANTMLVLNGTNQLITVNGVTANTTLTLVSVSTASPACTTPLSATSTVVVNSSPTLGTLTTSAVCEGQTAMINVTGLLPNSTGSVTYTYPGLVTPVVVNGTSTAAGTYAFTTDPLPLAANGLVISVIKVATSTCETNFATGVKTVTLQVNPNPT
uniref:beta strand repeat-containing protein n=1 Tax=Haliscomenobacter sp. TaxID=2717303 RepID=UPI00359439CF